MGTTENSAELTALLKQVLKERRDNFTFKPGTTDVETDVHLKADLAVGISEILKVIDVLKDAGPMPVLLPIEAPRSQSGNRMPNPLVLMVTIGEVKPDFQKVLVGGIELIHGPTVPHADKDTLPKEFVAVFVPKDGEYLMAEKRLTSAALVNELKPRIKQLADAKRLYVIIDEGGDFRYRSLAELAYAAHGAGAKEIYIITLKD